MLNAEMTELVTPTQTTKNQDNVRLVQAYPEED